MKKSVAISHFGTAIRLAKALNISKGAVSQWDDVIPEGSAYKLQVITGGMLQVDASLYKKPAHHAETAAA